ncbi:cytochrome P450 monooxygenase [Aspergillus steynii IBT 23096]|uniref:Cytochrome P450 monooxygenase n=1 Tax=Aspergillus steynii IBT 23096 TaxID=1392250 RepID=A0A2I2G0I7_9EURO|nr:cytochrome P450 monooxygenase [Aspergillus steynii IBT 23096]PLB46346.1 cytochrome P450 monooxygenase [Aspergillus steynii IBT 23096]
MSFTLAAAVTASLLLYVGALIVYRLFLHPFAKYPGPRLAAISNWYTTFYAWRGDLHLQVRHWHEQYGDVMRFGPSSLSFNTHTGMGVIYGARANVHKAEGYASMSASRRTPNTITAVDKTVHGFKRRIMGQVFSDPGLRSVQERFLMNIRDFTALLCHDDRPWSTGSGESEDGWGPTKDMGRICGWLAFDIISGLCYDEDFHMLHSPELRWFPSCIVQPKVFDWKIDRVLLATQYREMLEAGSWIRQRAETRARLGNDIKQKDLFYTMMNATDPKTGQTFTQKDLWLESMLLLTAGSDTTSTAMSAVFFYLAHHPDVRARLTQEIRTAFSNEEEICMGPQLNGCEFLRACVNETMRLIPSVSGVPPRKVQTGGITVDGEYIPAGMTVGTSIYTIQRNPRYFWAADEFHPQRWIADVRAGTDEESVKTVWQAFCPFGIGPRSCVGWRLAWIELNVSVARAIFLYDMRLAPEAPCCGGQSTRCDYGFKGWMTSAVEGPLVQFRPRQS